MDDYKKQITIKKIREAIENGNFFNVSFDKDGSGAVFYYIDNTGNHGLPCSVCSSLPIEDAVKVLSGFRFKCASLKHCM